MANRSKRQIRDEPIDLPEDGSLALDMQYFDHRTGLTMTNLARSSFVQMTVFDLAVKDGVIRRRRLARGAPPHRQREGAFASIVRGAVSDGTIARQGNLLDRIGRKSRAGDGSG